MTTRVQIDYKEFSGVECSENAKLTFDQIAGGFYVSGVLGCGKTRPTAVQAITEYLGGRELIQYQS